MSTQLKKKKNEVVRKVNLKLTCNCIIACPCTCTSPDGYTAPHVEIEADWCKTKHYNLAKNLPY